MSSDTQEHESELTFHDRVLLWAEDTYGSENVESEAYQRETRRYVDILVHGPITDFAIELENDAKASIKGIGQASLYAATAGHRYVPIVIVPDDHVDQPDFDHINERTPVHIREFPRDFPDAEDYCA